MLAVILLCSPVTLLAQIPSEVLDPILPSIDGFEGIHRFHQAIARWKDYRDCDEEAPPRECRAKQTKQYYPEERIANDYGDDTARTFIRPRLNYCHQHGRDDE